MSDSLNQSRKHEPMSHLLVKDIIRYLSNLANMNNEPRIGNAELSDGLRQLVTALRPYSQRPISELNDLMHGRSMLKKDGESKDKEVKVRLPENLDALSGKEVDAILGNQKFTKLQLIELGYQRFGIPRSKLMRLNRESVTESVRAALDHERSLDVISQEARRGGENRSS